MSLHVAILGGTGPAGGGLAQRFARAGLRVTIGSRNAERARTLAKEFSEKIGKPGAIAGDENRATLAQADIVVLTVPFEGHAELLKQLKPAFRPGIPVVDATVPLAAILVERRQGPRRRRRFCAARRRWKSLAHVPGGRQLLKN